MDGVDGMVDALLGQFVSQCLQAPRLSRLTGEQRSEFAESALDYAGQAILEMLVARLDEHQFSQIENLDPGSQEMLDSIQRLAATIPGFHDDVVHRLQSDAQYVVQHSHLPELQGA